MQHKNIEEEFDELMDNLPSRVSETPREVLKEFVLHAYNLGIEKSTEVARGMKKDEKTICPNCNGECQEIIGENLVSMDMAIDAQDRSLEGTRHSYEYKMCEICEGTGKIEMPLEYNSALSDLTSQLTNLLTSKTAD